MQSPDPLAKAQQKVRLWKQEACLLAEPVSLSSAVDLTTHPCEPRATFPGLTPFRVLTASDVVAGKDKLVTVPSIRRTALVSVCAGAVAVLLLLWKTIVKGLQKQIPEKVKQIRTAPATPAYPRLAALTSSLRSVLSLLRLTAVAVAGLWFARFVQGRGPRVRSISRYVDVSSTPERGPCVVADRILMITNSHAGTHADTPSHFMRDDAMSHSSAALCRSDPTVDAKALRSAPSFDDAHYTGHAVVLDVSSELAQLSFDTNAITVEVMDRALSRLPQAYRDGTQPLWRLVLVTRTLACSTGRVSSSHWDPRMAYLVPEAVEFLCQRHPRLLLLGTESASVDAPSASPICECSHGALLRHGVAILENLRCDELYTALGVADPQGVLEGSLMTVFNPVLSFEDSRGCSVRFFPKRSAGTTSH